jgi:hypothetical protein
MRSAAMRVPSVINRQTVLQAAISATGTAGLLDMLGASLDRLRNLAWLQAATGSLAILVALDGLAKNLEGDPALLRVMAAHRVRVPAGDPFQFHAAPNQFIEIYAGITFPTSEAQVLTVTGVLELIGYDEGSMFYRLR